MLVGGDRDSIGEAGLVDQAAISTWLQGTNPGLWIPRYGVYDPERTRAQLDAIRDALHKQGEPPEPLEEDHVASVAFVDSKFREYEIRKGNQPVRSFSFMVPSRTRRGTNDNKLEWAPLLPITRGVTSDVVQPLVAGLPPLCIDTYGPNADGLCGVMNVLPISGDIFNDLKRRSFEVCEQIMNDGFAFAERQGVSTVGLGATLPKLLFKFDGSDKFDDRGLQVTTGHTGTVWLMGEMTRALEQYGYGGLHGRIGVVGAGAIGMAYIADVRKRLGYEREMHVLDSTHRSAETAAALDKRNKATRDLGELIAESDIIIGAAIRPVVLNNSHNMHHRVVIDDSQPMVFDPANVRERGGEAVWVVAVDPTSDENTGQGQLTRDTFDYGGTGPLRWNHNWGCELELLLAHDNPELVRRKPVTPEDVRLFAKYAVARNVSIAPWQVNGEAVNLDNDQHNFVKPYPRSS